MDAVELAKNRIDLEHSDLIERRNAVYLVESALLTAALSTFFGNLQTNSVLILFLMLLVAMGFDGYRKDLDRDIRQKQIEVTSLSEKSKS
jgi:hypothetical protein